MKISKMSVELLDSMGTDLSVCNAARVSFAKESEYEPLEINHGEFTEHTWKLSDKDVKLISYLSKHGHWSPFAHTSLTFRISAPIFVARQLVKHQVGGVWNEVSRRYVDDEPSFFFPDVWRGKPINAKQGSSDVQIEWIQNDWWEGGIKADTLTVLGDCLGLYQCMIDSGVAPEQARMILPQNTMTEWWWTGSLMFFARVCKQRLDPHAQQETREVAQMIADAVPQEFTHSWKALMQ
jgi:thymidylate synthase (FAD)